MPTDEQRKRERFEEWVSGEGYNATRYGDGPFDRYHAVEVNSMWDGYRARDAEVQQLRKLVDHAKRIFQHSSISSGYCVCGDTPEHHSADCGYTDRGQWESELWLKRAALAGGEEGEPE